MTSFLDGRETVPSPSPSSPPPLVRPTHAPSFLPVLGTPAASKPSSGMQPLTAHRHGEAQIETVVVEGIVQKIIIHCGCGDRIELHCGY